ncbi:MAG: hypothetical protein JSV74_00045 [Dehalococcoidia bacterium]|nr:MAG: hypothetical protein JSV74_00045 [Dehalococcoidia bacterium]
MVETWENAYSQLEDFIKINPNVRIKKHVIAIPADIRPEFYRLFDLVRNAFLEEKCQALLNEAKPLSTSYIKAAEILKNTTPISEIKLPLELNWFLNDPIDGLRRSFYNSLFDLLKGEIDLRTFENEAKQCITNAFKFLFKLGYEKWIALSLINLIQPDKTLALPYDDIKMLCHEPEYDDKFGFLDKKLPDIEETKSIAFRLGEDAFMMANLIAHSPKTNRYISIGADISDATWSSEGVSDKREWIQIRELGKPLEPKDYWPDLVIYTDDKPKDISLVADFGRFCRPDIIVECMEETNWYQQGELEQVKHNYEFFKPYLGTYIVTRLPIPDNTHKEIMQKLTDNSKGFQPNINVLSVGYDQTQLNPIIETLLSVK